MNRETCGKANTIIGRIDGLKAMQETPDDYSVDYLKGRVPGVDDLIIKAIKQLEKELGEL